MAAYLDISDSQINKLLDEHIDNMGSSDELEKLIMKILRKSDQWSLDYTAIKKKVDYLHTKSQSEFI